MSTALHSFIDIFDTEFGEGQDAVQLKQIAIPIIQRDYAQGRQDPDVNRIRSCFLDSLYAAVTEKPITLDFIYGNIDDKGIMTPQRSCGYHAQPSQYKGRQKAHLHPDRASPYRHSGL